MDVWQKSVNHCNHSQLVMYVPSSGWTNGILSFIEVYTSRSYYRRILGIAVIHLGALKVLHTYNAILCTMSTRCVVCYCTFCLHKGYESLCVQRFESYQIWLLDNNDIGYLRSNILWRSSTVYFIGDYKIENFPNKWYIQTIRHCRIISCKDP